MFSLGNILQFIKKNFSYKDVLLIFVLIALFLLTRIINLDKWPQFSDEGIYITWAKTAWQDAGQRFISITDGRQPLQTWGTIPFLKIFSPNDLFAGRMFSVATGFAALLGIFSLNFYIFGKRAGYIASILYIFLPYVLFYDRMALVDSAVNAGFIWILFFSFVLAEKRRLSTAFMMGFVGGIALLAKSSSKMFLALSAAAPILYIKNIKSPFKSLDKDFFKKSFDYFILLAIAIGISFLFYNVQRLSPYFHYVAQKNTTFIMTRAEFFETPFAYFKNNFWNIPLVILWESGWTIAAASILGFFIMLKKDLKKALYLSVFVFAPYVAIAFFAKVLFPRYVLFYSTLLIIFATYFLINIKGFKKQVLTLSILCFSMAVYAYPLIFDPAKANFPEVDRGQYVEGVTAVWGAEKLMAKMQQESSQDKKTLVLAEGNFGLIADVLRVYDSQEDNVEILGLWPLDEKNLADYQKTAKERPVYVVFSHREDFPAEWPIEFVEKYEKPVGDKAVYLFKLK